MCACFGKPESNWFTSPESESSPESRELALGLAEKLGIETIIEDISGALNGAGCYQRRDEAIRRVIPQFADGWKSKITLPGSLLDEQTLNVFYLTVVSPTGEEITKRIPTSEFLQIMAASNLSNAPEWQCCTTTQRGKVMR